MGKRYDEQSIQTLDALSHIRLRTGMYIGRLGDGSHPDDGIYVLLKEVVDNSIDEYIMGHGRSIDITGDEKHQTISVRDPSMSGTLLTAPGISSSKLGQPQWLSNLCAAR